MKSYASYDEWKADQSARNRKLIDRLESLLARIAPELFTIVKWGQGCWTLKNTPITYVHAEPDHVQLGFYAGSTMKDPSKLLSGKGKYVRFVRIHDEKDIDEDALEKLVKQVL